MKIKDTVEAVTNVNKVMATQNKNVKETEESFNNIFNGVDSLDTLLTEVEEKNATRNTFYMLLGDFHYYV